MTIALGYLEAVFNVAFDKVVTRGHCNITEIEMTHDPIKWFLFYRMGTILTLFILDTGKQVQCWCITFVYDGTQFEQNCAMSWPAVCTCGTS